MLDKHKIHPQRNDSQEQEKLNDNGNFRQMQSTNPNATKGPLSYVPSEANPSPYTIIEKNKLHYIDMYNKFQELRFIEQLAGLMPTKEKQQLLEGFLQMFDDMLTCLQIIQRTILAINFDAQDFQSNYNINPSTMIDLIYKDVKTLEGFHIEMVYSSSLRYFETVLEAQDLDTNLANKLHQLDIKEWSNSTISYILRFKASPRNSSKIQ